MHNLRGSSRTDLRLVYQFCGHLIWAPKFKKVRKKKTNFLHKNTKLPSVALFSKLNIRHKSSDIEILSWCPAELDLAHGEKVPLKPWLVALLVMVS